jgi:formate--tetrahydrofolate ligase
MQFKSDIEIAHKAKIKPIKGIALDLGIKRKYIEPYGDYKAKINYKWLKEYNKKSQGKLILVTAINPTPAGEGKTTTSIGLGDSLNRLGYNTIITLREPSLGPVFGIKGGAAGGGYAQVIPMEDINLHFTGDIHAIGAANNLIAALIDNHIQHGNELNIDNRKITWKRCIDMNDRQLRSIINGLGGKANGIPREDGFDITVASEVMAVLCLSEDIIDLKERVKRMVIGYTGDDKPVTVGDLNGEGAVAALLKDTLKPNLVQTLENNPVFIHGGPFANIAHGCNSIMATKMALNLADYVVTEAGFGADLGAEKFLDIKCRAGGLKPSAVVIVATIRALKYNGGKGKDKLKEEDLVSLEQGIPNLLKHVENITTEFGLPAIVAINKFPTDTLDELNLVKEKCREIGVEATVSEVWGKGSQGGEELASKIVELTKKENNFKYMYDEKTSIYEKIEVIAKKIYGANSVEYSPKVEREIKKIQENGFGNLPVCIAKTQYSLSDDPTKLGRPRNFHIFVRDVRLSAGAGFIVVLTGSIMTMPGLPKVPSAEFIDVDGNGNITGLF